LFGPISWGVAKIHEIFSVRPFGGSAAGGPRLIDLIGCFDGGARDVFFSKFGVSPKNPGWNFPSRSACLVGEMFFHAHDFARLGV